ncbi:diguanylate cyclase [Curvibacter sp. CHRR-16]|uniref:sensor domain-containing diguanylate cyclase n=1 Tax=Curvibacter sp. CHRR-16 TaxID=2835872 RepID=UPI001BD93272|nr:diguanylate cyclase [Curvibacter sp. CHRR-16]MBT0569117.1 diguanylate cyclase [Curvibacter sp. CHRR-16]
MLSPTAIDNNDAQPVAIAWSEQDAPARQATLTRILIRIAKEALQEGSVDSIMKGICNCLVQELPVSIASVLLLNEDKTEFVHEVYSGSFTQSPLALTGRWPITVGAIGRCATLGQPHLVRDTATDPDYVPGNSITRSEYMVPVRHGHSLHGVLNLESGRTDFFDEESCAVFNAVADLVAGALHFARMADQLTVLNHQLLQLSMRDPLTGLANRRLFDVRLLEVWGRQMREGAPLALLMADADYFKALNDTAGHLRGDECLRRLACVCEPFAVEANDLVARYGGEEFVLLLPGRTVEQAILTAEMLREAVVKEALEHPASPQSSHVTVSIGVAVLTPSDAIKPEQLVAAADKAMYAAKSNGRNQVAYCAEPSPLAQMAKA